MKKYKGYYIDGVIFHSEAEIDEFHREGQLHRFKTLMELFYQYLDKNDPVQAMAASKEASISADVLVNHYGYTWEQIEEIELSLAT